jgi:hypothetical protein
MKRILVLAFTVFSVSLFAQNMPSGGVWGNTKVRAFTTAADTSAFLTLEQIKGYTNVGLAGGTVTSVGMSVPTGLSVSGSPITTSGTFAVTNNMAAGVVKSSGVGAALTSGTVSLTTEISGTLPFANGGTGATTQAAALTAIAGTQTANHILASNGTNTTLQAMTTAMLPTGIPNANLANSSITGALTSTGTDLTFSASTALGGTLTLNVPSASATARGVITTGAQTIAGAKELTGVTTHTGGSINSANTVYTNTNLTSATTLTTSSNTNITADATTAAFTITLPTTPTAGTVFYITKKNATTNYVTVTRGGANTIMGNTSHVIISKGIPTSFTFDGADWIVGM